MLHVDASQFARQGVTVEAVAGFPAVLDALADRAGAGRGFQRAAWYAGDDGDRAVTVVARRADGSPVAAIPSVPVGPGLVGARAVPGSYWPFRSIAVDPSTTERELEDMLEDPAALAALGPVWRVGPLYRDDRVTSLLKRAAGKAGWTVLTRKLGRTFLFDLAAMGAGNGWPRKSTRRRLANYEKAMAEQGAVRVRQVTGAGWDEAAFAALATIEANSWVGRKTDGSGAKFLTETQRERWRRALRDPVLAEALSATLLYVGEVPAAFSFDLRDGAIQYAIAGSYDERFAPWRAGKIVTYRQLEWARGRGVERVDLGAGDSGYKREMGAVPGSEIVDLLIVRSRSAAQLLRLRWGAESEIGRDAFREAYGERGTFAPLLAAGAIAAAVLVFTE